MFKGYKVPPTPADLTILYGDDAGISYGTSVARYKLLGKEFELENHWTATLVNENGRWLVANFHASANLFDNPVLNLATRSAVWSGIGGLVVGTLIMFIGAVVLRRRQRKA